MQDKTNSQVKPGYWLAASGTLFAVLVIVLGAFTRLVDAGLGCPDWPGCYGHILWPMDEAEVAAANAAFPEAPVEHDKTWPEQVHRLLATSLGLFCIAFVVMAYRQRQKGFNAPIKLTLVLLAMVIVQGMFGRWTVTLNLWPQVVTAHLIGGFTTLSLLWLLTLRLQNRRWQMTPHVFAEIQRLKPLLLVALNLLMVFIIPFLMMPLTFWLILEMTLFILAYMYLQI